MGEEIDEDMNRDKYLLLDSRVIESTENAKLTIGTVQKNKNNPLFKEDKPWEPRFDNLHAYVIYDEEDKLYRCWYNPFLIDKRVTSTPKEKQNPASLSYVDVTPAGHREIGLCYADSKDGIHWEKPELGLVEFDGNKKNNIVMRCPQGSFFGAVLKDLHDPDPARRYKILAFGNDGKGKYGWNVGFSPDGHSWSYRPILTPDYVPFIGACGAPHNVFWAPDLGKYVGIARQWSQTGTRQITRFESPDFVHWTNAQAILTGPNKHLQTHDMTVFPTCGIYIGLVGEYVDPEGSGRHVRQHVELAWSPDTVTWHRIQEHTPFIGNSPVTKDIIRYGTMPYDWGCIFAMSKPVFLDNEVRIYYGAFDWFFHDWRKGYLALATLRPDGWAGYEPTSKDTLAIVTTKTVKGQFASLRITADVQDGGSVCVAAVDEQDKELARSKPVNSTVTDGDVTWTGGWDLTNLSGKEIRLRFELNNAKLYAFQL